MRGPASPGALGLVFWALLALLVVAPCLHLAAGIDQAHASGKQVHHGWLTKMPWASTAHCLALTSASVRQSPPATVVAALPVIAASPFVPPEA